MELEVDEPKEVMGIPDGVRVQNAGFDPVKNYYYTRVYLSHLDLSEKDTSVLPHVYSVDEMSSCEPDDVSRNSGIVQAAEDIVRDGVINSILMVVPNTSSYPIPLDPAVMYVTHHEMMYKIKSSVSLVIIIPSSSDLDVIRMQTSRVMGVTECHRFIVIK